MVFQANVFFLDHKISVDFPLSVLIGSMAFPTLLLPPLSVQLAVLFLPNWVNFLPLRYKITQRFLQMLRSLLKATESERDYYIRRTDELQVEISRLTYLSSHHYHHGQSAVYVSERCFHSPLPPLRCIFVGSVFVFVCSIFPTSFLSYGSRKCFTNTR